ncbi:MAG: Hsp20 family protein [Candidatus Daviesbacteria bacterium]|nr:Hsp20 family protein [Candidatus Daviesbacteria bacterium]
MPNGLMLRDFWTFPKTMLPSIWEDLVGETRLDTIPSGLSVSEDEKSYYVDAALPGLDPKDIEVTFDRGILHIRGEGKEEEKGKKFYRKATSQFAYSVVVPESLDSKKEPKVTYKNGMMHAIFEKVPAPKPKRIEVKTD